MNSSRRARLTVIAVAAVIVATVVVSLGSNLWGSTYLLRSDTVFNHAPWSETVPVDFAITPITGTDPVDSGFPAHVQFFGRANDGDFAAWNPYPSGGVPLGSVPNTGPFDPLNLPFLFLADEHAPAAGKVLELALAIGGMVLFLRCFRVGYPVALFGGLIYAFNGFQTFWTNWPQSHVGALIPWLFWATERLLAARTRRNETNADSSDEPDKPVSPGAGRYGPNRYGTGIYGVGRYGIGIAVIVAIMFLVGFPAVTFFALAALAVYVIARSLASTHRSPSRGSHNRSLHRARNHSARNHVVGRTVLNLLAVIFFAVLGAGLAAWQLAPSVAQLDVVDTEYRQQSTQDRLPTGALLTTAVPNVIGSYALDRTAAQHNYFETQSFIGAGALVLAAVALLRRRARNLPRWLIPTLAGMTAIAVVLVYFGGPLLALAQQLPVIGTNRIGRLRAVILFFLSTLAAFGLASVVQKPTKEKPTKEKPPKEKPPKEGEHISRLAAPVISAAVVFVVGIAAAFWYFSEPARNNGHSGAVGRAFALAVVAAGVVVAVVVLARRHPAVRRYAVVVVSCVAAVEILVLAVPFWPNTDPALHYPTTEAHEFLFDQGANDRIATHDLTLYSGTTGYYGLRTVSGHSFHWPTWRDMLVAVDPLAEDWNDTFTILDFNDQQRMRSPILDRLAVRWIVNPLHIPPAGVPVQLDIDQPAIPAGGAPEAQTSVPAGESLSLTVPSQPLRGVSFYLSEALHAREIESARAAYLRVEVATSRGEVITSQRLVPESLGPGWPWIPIAGENIDPGGEMTITVSLETGSARASSDDTDSSQASSDDTDSSQALPDVLSLGTSAQGKLALFIMQPEDDNLRLAHVSGVAIWENLDAMKRIRFAPQAISEPDAAERLKWLAQDATGDATAQDTQDQMIVLSEQLPQTSTPSGTPSNTQPNTPSSTQPNSPSGTPLGKIVSVKDTFDELAITVAADRPGYVVVADAMQHGWTATVNGEAAEVLDADHAVVAVAVTAGTSLVEFSYHPPRLTLGLTISAISVVVLLLLLLAPRLLRGVQTRLPKGAKPRGHQLPRANEKSLAPPPQTSTSLETPPADQTSSKP